MNEMKKETAAANTWFKKLGLDSKIQVSFSIFSLFITCDKEVAVYSPTF